MPVKSCVSRWRPLSSVPSSCGNCFWSSLHPDLFQLVGSSQFTQCLSFLSHLIDITLNTILNLHLWFLITIRCFISTYIILLFTASIHIDCVKNKTCQPFPAYLHMRLIKFKHEPCYQKFWRFSLLVFRCRNVYRTYSFSSLSSPPSIFFFMIN